MNKLRILFLVISNMSLLSGSDLESLVGTYEDIKTRPHSDERTLRNQILLLRRHTPEWAALETQKESEESTVWSIRYKNMKGFKRSSSIQMSRARWAHENGISGEGVPILILEVKKEDHAKHVNSTVKQIAYGARTTIQDTKEEGFSPSSYKIINASFSSSDKDDRDLRLALSSTALLIQSAGNEGVDFLDTASFRKSGVFGHDFMEKSLKEQQDLMDAGLILVGNLEFGNFPKSSSNHPGREAGFQRNFIWTLGTDVLADVDGKNERMSGTSMAAPCATGVAALIAQAYPHFNRTQIKECLMESANRDFWAHDHTSRISMHISPDNSFSGHTQNGYLVIQEAYDPTVWGMGILDAKRALEYARYKTEFPHAAPSDIQTLIKQNEQREEDKAKSTLMKFFKKKISTQTEAPETITYEITHLFEKIQFALQTGVNGLLRFCIDQLKTIISREEPSFDQEIEGRTLSSYLRFFNRHHKTKKITYDIIMEYLNKEFDGGYFLQLECMDSEDFQCIFDRIQPLNLQNNNIFNLNSSGSIAITGKMDFSLLSLVSTLHYAVQDQKKDTIATLIRKGIDINASIKIEFSEDDPKKNEYNPHYDERTAIHVAIDTKNPDILSFVLQYSPDLDFILETELGKYTYLDYALKNQENEMVKILFAHGARQILNTYQFEKMLEYTDPEITDLLLQCLSKEALNDILNSAVFGNDTSKAETALKYGANPNSQSFSYFTVAIDQENKEMAKLFASHHAEIKEASWILYDAIKEGNMKKSLLF